MMKIVLTSILFSLSIRAEYDPCKYINYKFCGNKNSANKSLGSSQPSIKRNFTSPSSVALVKGFGIETILFDHFDFSLVFGTSKVGAGASGTNTDDTFFGNTSKEFSQDYEQRKINQESYEFKKYSLALAKTVISSKGGLFKFNLGALVKYIQPTKKTYFGPGASFVLGALNAGYARFKDQGESSLSEGESLEFNVTTYSVGLNIPFVSFDYTVFENDLTDINKVEIYSAGLFLDRWMLSYGRRLEQSDRRKYDFEQEVFFDAKKQWTSFVGVQYFYNKKITLGLLHNYYLNQEVSLVVTMFL